MLINFRDFGDERTLDGSRVQPDRLYRSGHMGHLDAAATTQLLDMDFAQVIDLRYADEREKDRSPWPDHALDRVVAHDGATADDAPHLQIFAAAMAGNGNIDDAYAAFYSALPYDRWYRPLFAEALRRLATTRGRVLVHCTAGKDRTGTLAALLLDMLGVPREAIVADYMRSKNAPGFAKLREEVAARMSAPGVAIDEDKAEALIGVKPAYVTAVFDAIEARSGSVERYFLESDVDRGVIDRLRANFLAG